MRAIIVWLDGIAKAVPLVNIGGKEYNDLKQALEVQTLLFAKDKFTVEQAVAWADEHDFASDKVDEGDEAATVIRLRQFDPEECETGSFKTFDLDDGVQAGGCKKKAAAGTEDRAPRGSGKRTLAELEAEGKDVGTFTGYIKSIEGNRIGGWASHKSADRQNEVVFPTAFRNIDAYMADNPIMLLFHDHNRLAIGKVTRLSVKDEGIELEAELFEDDEDFKKIRKRVAAGLMMFSVGFLVPDGGRREASADEKKAFGEDVQTVVEAAELLENSLVNIGANRRTLARLKALAVQSAERDIDESNFHAVTKALREMSGLANKALKVHKQDGEGNEAVAAAAERVRGIVNSFVDEIGGALDEMAAGGPQSPEDDEEDDDEGDEGREPMPPGEGTEQAVRDGLLNLKSSTEAILGRSQTGGN